MRRRAIFLVAVLLGLAAGAGLAAEPPSSGEAAEPVPLYTNADLERFGPSTAPAVPVDARIPDDWAFVQAFIDREYANIDADLGRQLARASLEPPTPPRSHYVLPYAGYYGYGYGYPYSWRGRSPQHGIGMRPEPRFGGTHGPAHFRSSPPRMPPGRPPSPQAQHAGGQR